VYSIVLMNYQEKQKGNLKIKAILLKKSIHASLITTRFITASHFEIL